MSYKQKKFETPIELHKILGNDYVVGLEERKAKRKQKKAQQKAQNTASLHHLDQVMLNRQFPYGMDQDIQQSSATQYIHSYPTDNSALDIPVVVLPYIGLPPVSEDTKLSTVAGTPETNGSIELPQPVSGTTAPTDSKEAPIAAVQPVSAPSTAVPTATSTEPPKEHTGKSKHHDRDHGLGKKSKSKHRRGQPAAEPVIQQSASKKTVPSEPTPIDQQLLQQQVETAPPSQPPVSSTPVVESTTNSAGTTVAGQGAEAARVHSAVQAPAVMAPVASGVSTPYAHTSHQAPPQTQAPAQAPGVYGASLPPTATASVGFGPLVPQRPQLSLSAHSTGPAMQGNLYAPWPVSQAPNPTAMYTPPYRPQDAPQHHGHSPHYVTEQAYAAPHRSNRHGASDNKVAPYNMFVLSAAPKLSFENMLAQQAYYAQQSHQLQQLRLPELGTSFIPQQPDHPQSQPPFQQAMHSPGSPGSLSMSMDNSMMSDDFTLRSQAARAEATLQDQIHRFAEIRSLFQMPSMDDVFGGPQYSSSATSRGRSHHFRDQTNLMDELAQSKLQESIDKHKQRLVRSRQPKYGRSAPQPSPRMRIHKARPSNNGDDADPFHSQSLPSKPHTTGQMASHPYHQHGNPAVSSAPTHAASNGPHLVVPTHMTSPPTTSIPVVNTAAGDAMFRVPTRQTGSASSATPAAAPGAAGDVAVAAVAGGPSSASEAEGEVLVPGSTIERELSVEEFEQAAARIEEQIRHTVEQSVEQSIVADAQEQHYTKRLQQKTLSRVKKPLEQKIEAKVEHRLAELKREVESLRLAKLAAPPVQPSVAEGDEDGEEAGQDTGRGAIPSDTWFRNNELKGSPKAKRSPKAGSVSPQHSVATATGTEADYQAITHDIKRSVEYVIKKHLRANPGLQLNGADVENMLFGSQLDSPSRDGGEVGFHSYGSPTPNPSYIVPPRRLSDDGSYLLRPVAEEPAAGQSSGAVSAQNSTYSTVAADQVLAQRRLSKASDLPGPAVKQSEVLSASPTQAQQGSDHDAPASKPGVLSSMANFFGSKSGKPAAAASSNQRSGHLRGKNKASALGPIADVDEGEASVAEGHADLLQREDALRAEAALRAATDRLSAITAAKSKVKKELKAWQKEFEAKVGRPATDADKSAIEDRFLYHQKLSAEVADAARALEEARERLAACRS